MQPGVYSNIPADDYHAAPGISTSWLKTFAKAPAKARYGEVVETDAMRFGTLIHTAITEPHEVERRYMPTDLDRRGTKAWEAEERRAHGRELVKVADWDDAMRLRDAVFRHSVARDLLLAPGPVEESFWWHDPATGLLRRGRADKIVPSMRIIADIKSTVDASEVGFGWKATDMLYDWQAASYVDGLASAPGGFEPEAFVFLAVEKEPPYLVGAYEPTPEQYDQAREQLALLMDRARQCFATDTWPGYPDTLQPLALRPSAAFR